MKTATDGEEATEIGEQTIEIGEETTKLYSLKIAYTFKIILVKQNLVASIVHSNFDSL